MREASELWLVAARAGVAYLRGFGPPKVGHFLAARLAQLCRQSDPSAISKRSAAPSGFSWR